MFGWIVLASLTVLAAPFPAASDGRRAGHALPSSLALSQYDVVVRGGRVIDPESSLDAIRTIGVRDGVVAAIGTDPLAGTIEIDATGLVVSPGFIDVVWQMPRESQKVQLLDGVTTVLTLWVGTDDVDRWYAERGDDAWTNFGVAVGHEPIRRAVMRDPGLPGAPGDAKQRAASDAEVTEIRRRLDRGLDRGALAVSFTNVTPAASGWEQLEVFRSAASAGAAVWAAPRESGDWNADDMPRFLTELVGFAAVTGVELCVVHVTASGGPHTPRLLRIVEEARRQGLPVTADLFPYTSNLSHIRHLDTEEWPSWPDDWFSDLEWLESGERLSRRSYERHRQLDGYVIVHNDALEPELRAAMARPFAMVVSGGYLDEAGRGHPRASGTHARFLGRYVRNEGVLSLGEAVRKMTLMPAQRLERRVPEMRERGRIREGARADLVVFDARRIIDRSTHRAPARSSEGIVHVLVNGQLAVRDGAVQEAVLAGRPIRARFASAAAESHPADDFLARLAGHCGQAFSGRVVADEPPPAAGDPFAGESLVMHVRECAPGEVRIPFHVGEDRSRTWIVTRTATGLRLKHDHRHADGGADEVTMYGGDTTTPGTATRQEFPVDAESIATFARAGLAASVTNTWALEVEPGRRFLYELSRPGGRLFRVEFDLTTPVPPPPAPWGHAEPVTGQLPLRRELFDSVRADPNENSLGHDRGFQSRGCSSRRCARSSRAPSPAQSVVPFNEGSSPLSWRIGRSTR